MNKIDDSTIVNYLYYLRENATERLKINDSNRLGIFAYGLVNYGFAETVEDINAIIIYIPSFEDLCTSATPINITYNTIFNNKIKIVDIRYFYEYAITQSSEMLEVLVTDYYIVGEQYKKLFAEVQKNREKMLRYNEGQRMKYAITQGIKSYNNWLSTHNNKDLFNMARLSLALILYQNNNTCYDCVKICNSSYAKTLQDILENSSFDMAIIQSLYNDLLKLDKTVNIETTDKEAQKMFKDIIFRFVRMTIEDTVDIDMFINNLTDAEVTALMQIQSEIGMNGNIIISKMTDRTGLSRTVYNNLFAKLKEYKIAEINNQGVKGTNIKFLIDFNLQK